MHFRFGASRSTARMQRKIVDSPARLK